MYCTRNLDMDFNTNLKKADVFVIHCRINCDPSTYKL